MKIREKNENEEKKDEEAWRIRKKNENEEKRMKTNENKKEEWE